MRLQCSLGVSCIKLVDSVQVSYPGFFGLLVPSVSEKSVAISKYICEFVHFSLQSWQISLVN